MKLLDQVRDVIRKKHYSIRTEQAYVDWIRRYILFHKKRHPKDMGECEVAQFISFLATAKNVAQNPSPIQVEDRCGRLRACPVLDTGAGDKPPALRIPIYKVYGLSL